MKRVGRPRTNPTSPCQVALSQELAARLDAMALAWRPPMSRVRLVEMLLTRAADSYEKRGVRAALQSNDR